MRRRAISRPRGLVLLIVALSAAACSGSSGAVSSPAASLGSPSAPTLAPTPTIVPSPLPDLVGQWQLDRTCQALVDGLIAAGHPELITKEELSELVETDDNDVPIDWDPTHPCAHALPPIAHSHTFWPNGHFNSYMDTGRRVDDGDWTIVDSQTFAIDQWHFHYVVSGDELRMEPIDPEPCDAACADAIGWMYAVAFPGQAWTRVTEGPNAP